MYMKNRGRWLSILLTGVMAVGLLAGCGGKEEEIVSNKTEISDGEAGETAEPAEASEDSLQEEDVKEEEDAVSADEIREEEEEISEEEEESEESGKASRVRLAGRAKIMDFNETLAYIREYGGKPRKIDYSKEKYQPSERDPEKTPDHQAPKRINEKIQNDDSKRIRMVRKENGATVDFQVDTDPEALNIDRIIATEYGSDGRTVTGYYFENAALVYAYRYQDDIYGTSRKAGMENGGKRCYFIDDFMAECYLTEKGKNDSYLANDYDDMSETIQGEYDYLEKELLNSAYITYDMVMKIPPVATIYGYAADEQGGTLKNTTVTITSGANNYSEQTEANGDGYYSFTVPINNLDWYNMRFSYGEFEDSEVDDIYIRPGTLTYCAGVTYLAPAGNHVHEVNNYLLNVLKQSPDKLSGDQYEIVVTYDQSKANLRPYIINLDTGRYENGMTQIVRVDRDSRYRFFLTDQRGGHSDNYMTYEMSLSDAVVKVYNKNGIVASFQVPVGYAGVVWEVFDINGAEIVPVDNYYFDVGKDIFFN